MKRESSDNWNRKVLRRDKKTVAILIKKKLEDEKNYKKSDKIVSII